MVTTRQYNGAHTAGIFADMTVDGPEIGTLVIVFDRAKNLPNRRTMGKQNPYCAARLGKDAKKTETDLRGGQTPKWDQELRFTVHDSPDYNTLKISVFSEDKKTDLIGEAWVNLTEVIVPGGGKNDLWQNLNCKGKYAGELRIEMTYYDSRPKPDVSAEPAANLEEERQNSARVKRRPLPTNPITPGTITPDTIPGPRIAGRARHGPRDYRTPPRANSMPFETQPYEAPEPQRTAPTYANSTLHHGQYHSHPPPSAALEQFDPYQQDQTYDEPESYNQADFLPQLPPSNRQRAQQPHAGRPLPRPQSHIGIPHANSAPAVPTTHHQAHDAFDGGYQLNTDYPEPLHDVDQLHDQMHHRHAPPPHSEEPYYDPYVQQRSHQAYADVAAPPPPPMHSNSSPAVPQSAPMHGHPHPTYPRRQPPDQYGSTPPSGQYGLSPPGHYGVSPSSQYGSPPPPRQYYSQGSSPAPQQLYQTPVRPQPHWDESDDEYSPSPNQGPYVTPPNPVPGQTPSPAARSSAGRAVPIPYRHSITDPYGPTPPRPHPLSQEVSRARSPRPYQEMPGYTPQQHPDYREGAPIIKPRAISPGPKRTPDTGRSSYSIQHPVRAFESSEVSPLSASVPRAPTTAPIRKCLSPRPTPPSASTSSIPFGPDSFDVHNPHARPPTLPQGNSPHNPYQIRAGAEAREEPRGPIVGWHGQEIDPSDHLPVDSWAPEPEKKGGSKTYGMGREHEFGPRTVQGITTVNGRVSRDTVINVRPRAQAEPPQIDTQAVSPGGRNKLTKKNPATRSPVTPLGEHQNYNPVPTPPGPYGGYNSPYECGSPHAYGAPHIPPKVPVQNGYSEDALAREIQSIDIGESRSRRGGSVPPPTAYVPVRSHRDRSSFY